jgi:hypothetical protein
MRSFLAVRITSALNAVGLGFLSFGIMLSSGMRDLSSTHPDIHIRTLDWFTSLDCDQRDVLSSFIENEVKPDLVLGADIV